MNIWRKEKIHKLMRKRLRCNCRLRINRRKEIADSSNLNQMSPCWHIVALSIQVKEYICTSFTFSKSTRRRRRWKETNWYHKVSSCKFNRCVNEVIIKGYNEKYPSGFRNVTLRPPLSMTLTFETFPGRPNSFVPKPAKRIYWYMSLEY